MINESKLNDKMFHLMESGFFGKQVLNEAEEIKQGAYGDPYQYKRVETPDGIKYMYAKKGNDNWVEQIYKVGIDSIKKLIFPKDLEGSSEKTSASSEKTSASSEKKSASPETKSASSETKSASSETKSASSETKSSSSETKASSETKSSSKAGSTIYDAIFVAGDRNVIAIPSQLQYFKNGFGKDRNVAAFDSNAGCVPFGHKQTIEQVLAENPKIPVFLYSLGAIYVDRVASNGNADVRKIFVIEPYYGRGQHVKDNIDAAIGMGVKPSQIYVGGYANVGLGVVDGATPTKSGNHFLAVTEVAGKHKNA
jgi:hypothetical protein